MIQFPLFFSLLDLFQMWGFLSLFDVNIFCSNGNTDYRLIRDGREKCKNQHFLILETIVYSDIETN